MYKIILSDGTVLENLELNGNNYISQEPIDSTVFEGKLSEITFTDGENTEIMYDAMLCSNRVVDGRSWLVFAEKTENMKLRELVLSLCENLDGLTAAIERGLAL